MFNKLQIEFYQSHKKSVFNFCKGVNVITGISTKGKTASKRAMEWLFFDKPSGFRFHSNFAGKKEDKTRVILDRVEKIKSKNKTTYKLDGRTDDTWTGAKVPDEIEEVLNISELNIQDQLDKPFLITDSPGEVARVINKTTKLDEVDDWIKSLTSKINTTNRDITRIEGEVQDTETKLKKYDDIDKVEDLVKRAERFYRSIAAKEAKLEALDELINTIENLEENIKDITPLLKAEKKLEEAEKIHILLADKTGELEELDHLIYQIELLEEQTDRADLLFEVESLLKDAEEIYNELEFRKNSYQHLIDNIRLIVELEIEVDEASDLWEESKRTLSDALIELGKCPTCFTDIGVKQVKKILEEL